MLLPLLLGVLSFAAPSSETIKVESDLSADVAAAADNVWGSLDAYEDCLDAGTCDGSESAALETDLIDLERAFDAVCAPDEDRAEPASAKAAGRSSASAPGASSTPAEGRSTGNGKKIKNFSSAIKSIVGDFGGGGPSAEEIADLLGEVEDFVAEIKAGATCDNLLSLIR